MLSTVRVHGEPGSLYAKCGGIFGVATFVDRCMDRWMENKILNANAAVATWHQRLQRCGFKFLVAQLVGSLSGGPQQYTGRPMDVAHKHLNIAPLEWTEFMRLTDMVCQELGLDKETTSELNNMFEGMRSDCVVEPSETPPPKPSPTRPPGDSLYARLGGVYPIALFVDRLIDALLVDDRFVIPTDRDKRNPASLKYLFTEVFCSYAGGRELITCEDLDETKLLLPKAAWTVLRATAEVAADHFPKPLIADILDTLESAKGLIVDPASQEGLIAADGVSVKDVKAAAAGEQISAATLAARYADPGAHVAARKRVFGDPRTMYGRVGGIFGLARLSSRLMDTWMQNPALNENVLVARWHESYQVYGFKFLVTQILAYLTGGPQRYTGRPMDEAHKHLNINARQWDHFMSDVDKVMDEFQVKAEIQRNLRGILAGFRSQCVVRPGEKPLADPGAPRPSQTTVGTLYHKLGGVYPIARFVDRLVELLLRSDEVQVDHCAIDDLSGTRHAPGLKYMLTELVCRGTGGLEVVTSRGFDPAKLGVQPKQWPAFMRLASDAATEVFGKQQLIEAMMSALPMLKAEICIGVDEDDEATDGMRKLQEFNRYHATAAMDRCGGQAEDAIALLHSGWSPEASPEGTPRAGTPVQVGSAAKEVISRCPFASAVSSMAKASMAKVSDTPSSVSGSEEPRRCLCSGLCSCLARGSPRATSGPFLSRKPKEVRMAVDPAAEETVDPSLKLPIEHRMVVGRILGNPMQDQLDDLLAEDPDLCCPVSLVLLLHPVIASDGFVYERSSYETCMKNGTVSPMSHEKLIDCVPASRQQEQAKVFRRQRSDQLLDFAEKTVRAEPQITITGLERVGEYVQVLKPEQVPEVARRAAELWESLGRSVPPELTGAASRRLTKRTSLASSPQSRSNLSRQLEEGSGSPSPQRKAGAVDFQLRLNNVLSTPDGAASLAKKLYGRFEGRVDKLPEIQTFLEEKWGFPAQLFSILWSHLRRAAFQNRGEHLQLHLQSRTSTLEKFPSSPKSPSAGPAESCGALGRIEESEWNAAFAMWLQAVQARCSAAKLSRRGWVQKRETSNDQALFEVYFQGPKLGEGAFGEVFVMLHKAMGVERVVKVIHKEQLSTAEENIESEVAVLKSLDHPHIVRVYETFDMESSLHIVMDYAEGGDLASLLKRAKEAEKTLTEAWVHVAAEQVAAALEYVHSKGVIHCDLKPANAMLLSPVDVEKMEMPHVLLVDFGLSEMFEERDRGGAVKMKGTPLYLSPEAFEGLLSEKSDMWAFGVMIYEMLLGRRPWQEGSVFILWSKIAKKEPQLDDLQPQPKEAVKALLAKDVSLRPTAKQCRSLPWFSELRAKSQTQLQAKPVAIGTHDYFLRASMFCIATELSMKDMGELFQVFKSIDKSGAGRLTLEQLAEGLQVLGIDQDPASVMAILDVDQNGYVSYTEFLAGALSTDEAVSERLVREAFDTFDLDGDGSISKEELRSMLSGDGPLVNVLPDGHTIEEVMAEVGRGEGVITFTSFKKYLEEAARASASGVDSMGATRSKPQEEEVTVQKSRSARRFSIENMLKEVDNFTRGGGSATGSRASSANGRAGGSAGGSSGGGLSDVSLGRGGGGQAGGRGEFGLAGGGPAAPREGGMPALHRWLSTTLAEAEHEFTAVCRFLDGPESCIESGVAAEHSAAIQRHFRAAAGLARLLAKPDPPRGKQLEQEVLAAAAPRSSPRVERM